MIDVESKPLSDIGTLEPGAEMSFRVERKLRVERRLGRSSEGSESAFSVSASAKVSDLKIVSEAKETP